MSRTNFSSVQVNASHKKLELFYSKRKNSEDYEKSLQNHIVHCRPVDDWLIDILVKTSFTISHYL